MEGASAGRIWQSAVSDRQRLSAAVFCFYRFPFISLVFSIVIVVVVVVVVGIFVLVIGCFCFVCAPFSSRRWKIWPNGAQSRAAFSSLAWRLLFCDVELSVSSGSCRQCRSGGSPNRGEIEGRSDHQLSAGFGSVHDVLSG